MVSLTLKVPVPSEYVFPAGRSAWAWTRRSTLTAVGRRTQPGARQGNGRANLGREGDGPGSRGGKVRADHRDEGQAVAPHQPVPPASTVSGYPPAVEFDGLTITPYVDVNRCGGSSNTCRARMAYSLRASGLRAAAGPAAA